MLLGLNEGEEICLLSASTSVLNNDRLGIGEYYAQPQHI